MIGNNVLKYKNKVWEILFFLIILVFCTPILSSSNNIVLIGVLLGLFVFKNIKYLKNKHNASLLTVVILYLTTIFLYRFIGLSDAAWGNYLYQLVFFTCILLMPCVQIGRPYGKLFLFSVWTIIIVNVVDNIVLSYMYPSINTARFYVDEEFLSSINAGGPSFYMFILFVFSICLFIFLNSKLRQIRILMLFSILLCTVYICVFCLKASVVVFFFLSIIFIYYAKRTQNQFAFFSVLAITGVLSFIFFELFSEELVEYIISMSPDERLSTRLVALISPEDIEAETGTHSMTSRTDLYLLSIKTWLSDITNFLFGIGDHRVQLGAAKTGISQHSDLLDILAIYGLLGMFLIVFIFKYAFRETISLFDDKYKLQVKAILMLFVLYGLIEKIFFPMAGVVMFLLLPLSAGLINKKEG